MKKINKIEEKIEVEKLYTRYGIENEEGERIYVDVMAEGISLFNHNDKKEFVFELSDPERIKRIAALIKTAAELKK